MLGNFLLQKAEKGRQQIETSQGSKNVGGEKGRGGGIVGAAI